MSGDTNPTDLVLSGRRKGCESAKPKEYFSWKKLGHSKGEYRYSDLDTIATTEQLLRTLARPEVRIESPREISANSKFLNTSVGTQKVEREFAVRNVTKLTDAAGQLTDEGREARPSEADGLVWSVKSAERIMRLLRSNRSFSELKDQKGEYVTPCDEQLCAQESSQARQMGRGEIEVEEETRVRAKRVPVLPIDKEKDENEIRDMTIRSAR